MKKALEVIKNFCKEEDGVVALEYGLVAALVAIAITAAFVMFGPGLTAILTKIDALLNSAATTVPSSVS